MGQRDEGMRANASLGEISFCGAIEMAGVVCEFLRGKGGGLEGLRRG